MVGRSGGGGGDEDLVSPMVDSAADLSPPSLRWVAHGSYLFKGSDEPFEVFEVGADGIAPLTPPPDGDKARRLVTADEEETLGWRPAVGQEVPGRQKWVLERKVGEGGFGEVWLARHGATKHHRVFKFCHDAERLRSFKREITLFRLLREALGERRDIAKLYEVRLDEAPFYLESEYSELGSLSDWAAAQGGIAHVALPVRLDLVARVADAVAAAHSVGVLHKDIKPSNVLIHRGEDGEPLPRLADFGIGMVTDRSQLAARNITEAGFTQSVVTENDSSRTGTRLYAPPEALAGRPFTVQGDVYALGVFLYQMVVGHLERPLGQGWEREIRDDLLREDIAACVEGEPARRLDSAAELARRLRALVDRRKARVRAARTERRGRIVRRVSIGFAAATAVGILVVALVASRGEQERQAARLEAERLRRMAGVVPITREESARVPAFTVSQHPAFGRPLPKDDEGNLLDSTKLRFNHKLHIVDQKLNDCAMCHSTDTPVLVRLRPGHDPTNPPFAIDTESTGVNENDGSYMRPIDYERHCQQCHPVKVSGIKGQLFHGQIDLARAQAFARFQATAMRRYENPLGSGAVGRSRRFGRGAADESWPADEGEWLKGELEKLNKSIIGVQKNCARCHDMVDEHSDVAFEGPSSPTFSETYVSAWLTGSARSKALLTPVDSEGEHADLHFAIQRRPPQRPTTATSPPADGEPPRAAKPKPRTPIAPVRLEKTLPTGIPDAPRRWFVASRFDHRSHRDLSCVECHSKLDNLDNLDKVDGITDEKLKAELTYAATDTKAVLSPGMDWTAYQFASSGEGPWTVTTAAKSCSDCHKPTNVGGTASADCRACHIFADELKPLLPLP